MVFFSFFKGLRNCFSNLCFYCFIFFITGNLDVATPTELLPLIPPQAGEKGIDDSCRFFLDSLMEFMITQVNFYLIV